MSRAHFFGKYELVGLLSVGGMAEVHLASITGPGGFRKFVVVKRILPDLKDDPQFSEMFMSEARLTSSLSHSNIAQVFEFGEIDQRLYLSMEFIHGIDLVKVIKHSQRLGAPVPPGLALRLIRDVSVALHYAHTFVDPWGTLNPVIHRDITPRNVMLSNSGTVKIIDFGIAKVVGTDPQTTAGNVKGSVGYMAPEQVLGETLDPRCDVFSVGVILHELLTGRRLFSSADPAEAMRRVVTETPPSPRALVPELPEALSALTMKALERDRANRFATAHDLAAAIEEAAGPSLYDEYKVGAWVREQFPLQLEQTRKLLVSLEKNEGAEVRAIAVALGSTSTAEWRPDATPERALEATTTLDPARGATVLVVDDSSIGRKVVTARLEGDGFKVVACASAEEALATLAEMTPDLILSDVHMGALDGFELCALVRQQPGLQALPFIFLSSSCSAEERSRGMSVGGDDFIRKPFEPADLVTRVRAHLRRVAVLKLRPAPA